MATYNYESNETAVESESRDDRHPVDLGIGHLHDAIQLNAEVVAKLIDRLMPVLNQDKNVPTHSSESESKPEPASPLVVRLRELLHHVNDTTRRVQNAHRVLEL